MRVLHVAQPTTAGVPGVVLDLTRFQRSLGWDVHVASPIDGHLFERAAAAGATFHRWEAVRSPGPSVPYETARLRQIVARVAPDVVVLHSAKAGLAGRLAVHGSRPTVFMPHAWSFESVEGAVREVSVRWERIATRWTDLTLCVSEAERALGEAMGCLGHRTAVVPNGVDVDLWSPAERADARDRLRITRDRPVAVLVGRLSRHKGQDLAIRAWEQVTRQVPQAELYLVGEGPAAEELTAQAGAVPGVTLVGQDQAKPWLDAADVVLLPSRWEGMPLVLLEAMASGRSVVASRVAGTAETLDDDRLVGLEDVEALAGAIVRRFEDPELRAHEESANRQTAVNCFDLRETAQRMTALIAEAGQQT